MTSNYPSGLMASMIQDVNISTNLGKDSLFEMGRKAPYYKYPIMTTKEKCPKCNKDKSNSTACGCYLCECGYRYFCTPLIPTNEKELWVDCPMWGCPVLVDRIEVTDSKITFHVMTTPGT